jgi:hypothetical protein
MVQHTMAVAHIADNTMADRLALSRPASLTAQFAADRPMDS